MGEDKGNDSENVHSSENDEAHNNFDTVEDDVSHVGLRMQTQSI